MAGLVLSKPPGFEAQFPLGGSAEHADGRESSQVGLYATEQEAQRVVDLLRLKEALDSGSPLQQVPLYLSLQEYMGNDSTMQYLRDHDMHTVWATFHACGAEQLQPAGGGSGAPPMPAGSGAAALAITPRSAAGTAGTAGGAGVLTGRNWWEQLSEVEDEEAESGDGAMHEAFRGDDREGEAGWVTELDSGDEAAASEGVQSGAEGASRRHTSQRHGSGSPAAVSQRGKALDREQSVDHSVGGRPRRAAALRNKQVVATATAAAELEEARRHRAAATAAAALQRAQQEEARRRQQLAAAQQAQQRVAQQAQQAQQRVAQQAQQAQQQAQQQQAQQGAQQSAQQSQSPPRQQEERQGQEECEEEDGMVEGEEGMPSRKRAKTKTIIFPPVPASMKCGQCVNCQNPQRKRPCVLARRRLLELLREQEAAAADAEEAALEAGEAGGGAGDGTSLPTSPAAAMPRGGSGGGSGACALRTGMSGGGFGSSELSEGLDASATPKSPAAAIRSALNLPSRKQLYPVIPPTERCGRCKPCLNPKLKKACREARQRQLEAGVAPPLAQLHYNAVRAGGSPLGSPTAAAAAAAAAAAGASGRPRVPQSAATAAAVAAGRLLGASVIGCRIRIYWGGMRRWYEGTVGGFDASSGQHHIEYDDGDQQEHMLGEEKYILLDPPRALPAGQAAGEAAGQAAEAGDDKGGAERPPPAKRLREDGQGAEEMQAQQQQQAQQQGESGGNQGTTHKRAGGGSACATPGELAPGGSGATAPETPAAAAAAPAALPLLVQSTPVGPAAAAAAEAVMQLPAALALLCRRGCDKAAAASEAGVSVVLVGRFMAAFSCRMSQGQRQEHAAFLLPLIEGECYEGVQACLQEALLLCPKPQDRTTTFGSAPAALPGGASPESTQRAQHEQPAAAHPPDSSAVGTTGGGASTSGSGSDGVAAALEHAVAAVTQTA